MRFCAKDFSVSVMLSFCQTLSSLVDSLCADAVDQILNVVEEPLKHAGHVMWVLGESTQCF